LIGQLYVVNVTFYQYSIIIFGCISWAVISAGVPASVCMLGITHIFNPLGLYVENVTALLTVLTPFLDPLLTLNNVISNITAVTYIADHK